MSCQEYGESGDRQVYGACEVDFSDACERWLSGRECND
jgi:hypothetical protein